MTKPNHLYRWTKRDGTKVYVYCATVLPGGTAVVNPIDLVLDINTNYEVRVDQLESLGDVEIPVHEFSDE